MIIDVVTNRMERMVSTQAQLNAYYGKLSCELADQPSRIHAVPQRQQEFQRLVEAVVDFSSDINLFEIACGIGYWTGKFKNTAQFVHATDICETALQLARRRVVSDRVLFSQADAMNLVVQDDGIAGVFGGFWLSHIPHSELRDFFSGLNSQLSRGARVLFVDNEYPLISDRLFSSVEMDGDTYELRSLKDGTQHFVLKNCFTDNELKSALSQKAMKVSIDRSDYYWSLSYEIGP